LSYASESWPSVEFDCLLHCRKDVKHFLSTTILMAPRSAGRLKTSLQAR